MPRQACPCQAYLGNLFMIANSVDPDQMSHIAASDFGLHCLSMSLLMRHKAFTHGDVVVVLLFYVHGKHLRSCRDGQLT